MSDFVQYPFQALQDVGRAVAGISERIASGSTNAFEIGGLDFDQARIGAALDHFRSEWEASLQKLGENIGGFGAISTQLGAISASFDRELATSLNPGGQGGRGARGRAI